MLAKRQRQRILFSGCRYGSEEGCRPSPVPSRIGLMALLARQARDIVFDVQQPCSQFGAWHAVDPAGHGDASVLVTITESVSSE